MKDKQKLAIEKKELEKLRNIKIEVDLKPVKMSCLHFY
jgi:hypothetical protein